MKNYEEMYQSVLSKYDEYLEKKKKRMLAIRRTVPVLACLCFVAILGIGRWNQYSKFPEAPMQNDVIAIVTKETNNNTSSTTYSTSNTHTDNRNKYVTTTVTASATKLGEVSTTEKQQASVVSTVVTETMSNRENIKITAKQADKNEDSISVSTYTITTLPDITVSVTQSSKISPLSSQMATGKQVNTVPTITSTSIITQTSRITTLKQVNTMPITSTTSKSLDISKTGTNIRVYSSFSDNYYKELKENEVITIINVLNTNKSNASGFGLLFEIDSINFQVSVSTNEGYFMTEDIGEGSIKFVDVGKSYYLGHNGRILWKSENTYYQNDIDFLVIFEGFIEGKNIKLGEIVITQIDENHISVVLKKVDSKL